MKKTNAESLETVTHTSSLYQKENVLNRNLIEKISMRLISFVQFCYGKIARNWLVFFAWGGESQQSRVAGRFQRHRQWWLWRGREVLKGKGRGVPSLLRRK